MKICKLILIIFLIVSFSESRWLKEKKILKPSGCNLVDHEVKEDFEKRHVILNYV
jgi:hypothetical protein